MDASELFSALRAYHRKRRVELLDQLVSCEDVQKQRGRILELDTSYARLQEIFKTTGDEHDDDSD